MTSPARTVTAVVEAAAEAALEARVTGLSSARAAAEKRTAAAGSRWLGPALAAKLARSTSALLRARVATNLRCPEALLAKLTHDRDLVVRTAALDNPRLPYPVVAEHPDGDPLTHPACPGALLDATLADPLERGLGHTKAALHPNLSAAARTRILTGDDESLRAVLLENPHLTHAEALAVFETLPANRVGSAQMAWAAHPAADPAWLTAMLEEHYTSNRTMVRRVAANPTTPPAVLARIVAYHPECDTALGNPSCPSASLATEALMAPRAGNELTVLRSRGRRRIIAANPAADRSVLQHILATDVRGDALFAFTLTHARTAAQAHAVLTLAPTWTGHLSDLLDTTAAIVD